MYDYQCVSFYLSMFDHRVKPYFYLKYLMFGLSGWKLIKHDPKSLSLFRTSLSLFSGFIYLIIEHIFLFLASISRQTSFFSASCIFLWFVGILLDMNALLFCFIFFYSWKIVSSDIYGNRKIDMNGNFTVPLSTISQSFFPMSAFRF